MPFKDRVKRLAYGRKYQAMEREKLEELKKLHDVETQVVRHARDHLVGRRFFYIKQLPNSGVPKPDTNVKIQGPNGPVVSAKISTIPVISTNITLPVTPRKIKKATLKMVESEDTLLLTGEHKGWPAMGIEGLATAKGRNTFKSCGDIAKDLLEAREQLIDCGYQPPYSIITNRATMRDTNTEFHYSPYLYNQEGKKNSILVVKPNQTNFILLMGQDLNVCRQKNGEYKLWETLVPTIYKPKAICEIQNCQTIPNHPLAS